MGKSLVTSYAALGVGLAIVLTFGLTAISSVMEQPSQNQFMVSQQESAKIAPQAPLQAAPAPPPETQKTAREGAPAASSGAESGGMAIQKAPAKKEEAAKSYSIVTEVPASPFAGLFVALPYIAAAVVGSVVFVITRKKFL